jgi:hypothetical protein
MNRKQKMIWTSLILKTKINPLKKAKLNKKNYHQRVRNKSKRILEKRMLRRRRNKVILVIMHE